MDQKFPTPKQPDLYLCSGFRVSKSWCAEHGVDIGEIKQELTVTHNDARSMIYRENDAFLTVPRYYGLKRWSNHKECTTMVTMGNEIPPDHCVFTAQLQEDGKKQVTATKACLVKFFESSSRGCVLRLPCGFGKTVCALFLVSQRRRRTLYVVQAENLFQQTIASIQRLLPHARIGTIQGPTKTWQVDADIVVAMMQTLHAHRDQLRTPLTWSFGLIVVDECHHLGAPTFYGVLQKFAPAYFLGLTATPQRMDGKSDWIEWMMGPVVNVFHKNKHELKRSDIEVIWSPPVATSFPPNHLVFTLKSDQNRKSGPKYPTTIWLNLLVWDTDRRHSQTQHTFQHVFSNLTWTNANEPQIVVFAARIFQLCLLSYTLQKQYIIQKIRDHFCSSIPLEMCNIMAECIFHHDGMDYFLNQRFADDILSLADYYKFARNKARTNRVTETQVLYLAYVHNLDVHPWMFPMRIATTSTRKPHCNLDRVVLFATVQKLGEGVDINTLHTVCLTSSLSAHNLPQLEQVIGRLRKKPGVQKKIIDFMDDSLFKHQIRARKKFYNSRGIRQIQS